MKRGQAQMPRKQHFLFLALQSLTVKRAKEQQKKQLLIQISDVFFNKRIETQTKI